MDKETIEIRWHGRAGQGVVTAAVTLADVISTEEDLYVQAFPEFGAEKRGAPILAFNRISKRFHPHSLQRSRGFWKSSIQRCR